jgi:hypothetical protein
MTALPSCYRPAVFFPHLRRIALLLQQYKILRPFKNIIFFSILLKAELRSLEFR